MSDLKSKWPDMNELGSMAKKLFDDVKSSVCSIIGDYKQKRPVTPQEQIKPEIKKPVVKVTPKPKKEEL